MHVILHGFYENLTFTEKKPLANMTGHQQLVNDVKFSPDARLIASASFDKSVRLWNGTNGQFMARLLGMLL